MLQHLVEAPGESYYYWDHLYYYQAHLPLPSKVPLRTELDRALLGRVEALHAQPLSLHASWVARDCPALALARSI